MTELEILAELKIAYIQLEDIIENQEEQIEENEKKYLRLSMNNLIMVYQNLYKRIEKEDDKILYYENDIKISKEIFHDYMIKDEENVEEYITSADLDEEEWWEDYNFLWGN